jgi:integrase
MEIARSEERAEQTGMKAEIRRNPAASIDRPSIRQTRVVFLLPNEWRRLIEVATDTPVAAALGLWCLAGLRFHEAVHLRTDIDIIVDSPSPRIEIQPRGGQYPWRAKTDRSNRRIPVPFLGELHKLLLRHIELGYAGDRYFLRPDRDDRPYHEESLRKMAKRTFIAAGIKWGTEGDALTVHSLRHTFVSWLVQQDVQAMKIAKLIGDKPEQVYHTYGHLLPDDLHTVVKVLDNVARGEGK